MRFEEELVLGDIIQLVRMGDTSSEEGIEEVCSLISNMNDSSLIEKALDVSRLRRVKQLIHRRDGTVYMKTVYKKLEEVSSELSSLYNKQLSFEENIQVGDRATVRWVGESTGSQYETDWAEVASIQDKTITIKLTKDFETGNRNLLLIIS